MCVYLHVCMCVREEVDVPIESVQKREKEREWDKVIERGGERDTQREGGREEGRGGRRSRETEEKNTGAERKRGVE